MNPLELTGRARSHLVEVAEASCHVHRHAVAPLLRLRAAARVDGIAIEAVSGYRDFERQAAIWNGKFDGSRTLLDAAGHPLDGSRLSAAERVDAILRWSALPGASRHHWGTDLDLMDANAVPRSYRTQLSMEEYAPGGPFQKLCGWLQTNASRFGFFRPFRGIASGVQAEPWHVSFAPVAEPARRALTPTVLRDTLAAAHLQGQQEILRRLEELHARYVAAIDLP